jgi:hypothetical protein
MSYNGWSNRETWNVSLWLNNDEPLYRRLCRLQELADSKEELAEDIEKFCADIWPDGKTPDGDNWHDADFDELAESEWDDNDHPPKTFAEAAESYGIGFSCSPVASRPDKLMDEPHMTRHFRCRISHGRRSFGLYFSQGSGHTEAPTLPEVLDCLISDASGYENYGGFEEWCGEYGYDSDSRKAEKVYRAVKRQAEQLKRTVGEDVYNVLLECERL